MKQNEKVKRESDTKGAVRVQKEPEGQLVGGQREKETPMGAELLSEERRKRNTARQKHADTGRQGRDTDRETDAAGQKKQAKAPVDSACQQCCNCRLMVDSPGGKMMAGGGREGRRNVAEIRR